MLSHLLCICMPFDLERECSFILESLTDPTCGTRPNPRCHIGASQSSILPLSSNLTSSQGSSK